MLHLYGYRFCSHTRKIRIILEEKEIEYHYKEIDLADSENEQDYFLKLSPFGEVPVLVHDGVVLFDALVISDYLDSAFKQVPLYPQGFVLKSQIRLIEQVQVNHLNSALNDLNRMYYHIKPGLRDNNQMAQAYRTIQKFLKWLEPQLEDKTYFCGENFSMADIALVHPLLSVLPQFNVDISDWKNIKNWADQTKKRKSVENTDPGHMPQIRKNVA